MAILGIELNDAALAVCDGQSAPVTAPGYAVATDGGVIFGGEAWKTARLHPRRTTNRFWCEISDQPLAKFMDGQFGAADLAHDQLRQLIAGFGKAIDGAVFAMPPQWSTEQLGLLLGIAQDLALPVTGFVDSAVAATRREYQGGALLHLDASLHGLTITRMHQAGKSSVDTRRSIDRLGIDGLERVCVEFIASQFVDSTRFDPLHDGESEQYLYDNLHAWLSQLNREDRLALTVEYAGNEFKAGLKKADLAGRISAYIEPVVQQVRSLLSVGVPAALQVGDRLASFPGVVEALGRISRVSVFVLESAAAAKGALARADSLPDTGAGVRLTTALPWDQPPVCVEVAAGDAAAITTATSERPTHVMFGGRAYRLEKSPFNIGSALSPGDYGVMLDGGQSGVSRRHCTIQISAHGVEVVDNSRYGTRLNGHMIDGAAILQSGDVLSLGNPVSEFLLITETTAPSATKGSSNESGREGSNGT